MPRAWGKRRKKRAPKVSTDSDNASDAADTVPISGSMVSDLSNEDFGLHTGSTDPVTDSKIKRELRNQVIADACT